MTALFLVAVAAGCAPYQEQAGPPSMEAAAMTHRVHRGETLWSIARRYGVSLDALVEANRISDASRIEVGQRLRIPGSRLQPVRPPAPAKEIVPDSAEQFIWPVQGRVISIFGTRWRGRVNKGIDIQARAGTEVRPTRSGKVSFVHEGLTGFGKTIIVEHAEGFASVYATVGEILVRQGDWVAQRQVIARVGETGRTHVPALHFEIRRNQKAQNPLHYLP